MALTQIRQVVINEQYSGVVPVGGIVMFSGNIAALPSGWSFCNGTNGTPDLRDKFIIGAAADNSGQANTTVTGSTTKLGGTANLVVVSHNHTGTSDTTPLSGTFSATAFHNTSGTVAAAGIVSVVASNANYSGGGGAANSYGDYSISANHQHTFTANTTGSSGTNANLPPYYALAFIMRIS